MDTLIYIAKSTALLSLFFLAYEFLLKRDTFFQQNRIFLLVGLTTAAFLPLFVFTKTVWVEPAAASTTALSKISQTGLSSNTAMQETSFWASLSIWDAVLFVYFAGVAFFLIKFLKQFFSLAKLLRKKTGSFSKNGIKFIETDEKTGAFSFFKTVVFNPELYSREELNLILKHEKAHARNNHNVDIILGNLIKIAFWFNPLAWLYRKRISQNLEFLADRDATKNLDCSKDYQRSLVNASLETSPELPISNFHKSFIKTRIIMLHKTKSHGKMSFKAFLIVPFLVLFLFGFQIKTEAQVKQTKEQGINVKSDNDDGNLKNISFIIRNNSTREDLNGLRDQMKNKHNIDVNYSNLKFNEQQKIVALKVSVDCNDGFDGSTSASNKNGIDNIYFNRNYDNKETPFEIGQKQVSLSNTKILELVNDNNYFIFNGKKVNLEDAKGSVFTIDDKKILTKNGEDIFSFDGARHSIHTSDNIKIIEPYLIVNEDKTIIVKSKWGILINSASLSDKIRQLKKGPMKDLSSQLKKLEVEGKKLRAKGEKLKAKGEVLKVKGKKLRAQGKKLRAKGKALKVKGEKLKIIPDSLKLTPKQVEGEKIFIVVVSITKNTSKEKLESYKDLFDEHDIDFSYKNLKRNAKGEITKIKLSINNHKGTKTSTTFDGNKPISDIKASYMENGHVFIHSES